MHVGPSLITVVLLAMIMAFPVGAVLAVCALAVHKDRRRYALLAAATAAVLAAAVTMLIPTELTQVAGPVLLVLGVLGASVAGVLILLRRDVGEARSVLGLIAAPLATAGHLMASAPALAALGPLAGPPGGPGRSGEFLAVLGGGLAGGGVTILGIAVVLLLLRRAWEPIGTGIALGGVAAALALGAELVLALLSSQAAPLTTTTTLMVTALGLVIGTFIGAMRTDRSGALAGMPPGNH